MNLCEENSKEGLQRLNDDPYKAVGTKYYIYMLMNKCKIQGFKFDKTRNAVISLSYLDDTLTALDGMSFANTFGRP